MASHRKMLRENNSLPSHVSPVLSATEHEEEPQSATSFSLQKGSHPLSSHPPPSLLSPAFTPAHSGLNTPTNEREPVGVPVDTSQDIPSQRTGLLAQLPEIKCVVRARIPTVTGAEMFLHLYSNNVDNKEHLAIVFSDRIRSKSLDAVVPGETERDRMIRGAYVGRLHPGRLVSYVDKGESDHNTEQFTRTATSAIKAPLVRIHSECYTGETAWSARCDCGEQLDEAARLMSLPGSGGGVIVYLRQEGRGIGLGEKLKAYNLQDLGSDTVEANLLLRHPADARSYGLATAMLVDLGLGGERGIRLLTNNPDKIRAVEGPNREIVVKERVPMIPLAWKTGGAKGIRSSEIEGYLQTKIGKMGHMLG